MATSHFYLDRKTQWLVQGAKHATKRINTGKKDDDGKTIWEEEREVNDAGLKGWKFEVRLKQAIPNPEEGAPKKETSNIDVKIFLPDDFDPDTVEDVYVEFEDMRLWAYSINNNAYISFRAESYKLTSK